MPPRSRIGNFLRRLATTTRKVQAGTETDFFVAHDANRVEFKPGIEVKEEKGPDGETRLVLMTADGEIGGHMYCRCPKGYRGSCDPKGAEGDPIRECKGTCQHVETLETHTCGWFLDAPSFSFFGIFGRRG